MWEFEALGGVKMEWMICWGGGYAYYNPLKAKFT